MKQFQSNLFSRGRRISTNFLSSTAMCFDVLVAAHPKQTRLFQAAENFGGYVKNQSIEETILQHGLPRSEEAEKAILASMLLHGRYAEFGGRVEGSDFSTEQHRRLLRTGAELHKSRPADYAAIDCCLDLRWKENRPSTPLAA